MCWKRSNPNCNGNRRDKVALRNTCIKKCQIQYYQNKDRLSVFRILLLQRKPQLSRTNPSTGPHAARGLDIPSLEHAATVVRNLDPQSYCLFVASHSVHSRERLHFSYKSLSITSFFTWRLIAFSERDTQLILKTGWPRTFCSCWWT